MKSTASIRIATIKDLPLLLELVREYHEFEEVGVDQNERILVLRRLLSNKSLGVIWMVIYNEQVVGYLALCKGFSIEFAGVDAFVDEFFIRPEYRGKGLGSKTLKLVIIEAKKMDIRALHLEVARTNKRAQSLYGDAGFKQREKYVLMTASL